MQREPVRIFGILVSMALITSACAGQTATPTASTTATPSTPTAGATSAPASPRTPPPPPERAKAAPSDKDFDPRNFSRSTEITNRYFPMVPGMHYRWEGHAFDEGDRVSRAIEFVVTDQTKVINGVRTVVARDTDITDGEREELELTFYAQDDQGTVWYFGEYPEEYDESKIVKSPVWLAGLRRARPGIVMPAEPRTGTPDFAEGWGGSDVNWTDRGRVARVGVKDCVRTGCYTDVVVVKEFNPDEPGREQLKYYAPGVGGIRTGWGGANEVEKEELILVERERLGPAALAELRREVLQQERRANRRSPDVYAKTPPMRPR